MVLILTIVLAYLFLDERQLKPAIEKMLSGAIGCSVTLGEELDFSLFPWVGVSVSDLKLENPEGFKEKQILTANSFKVKVKLLPLFSGKLQVGRLVLDSPRLILERNRDGRLNLREIGSPLKNAVAETPEEKESMGMADFSLISFNMTEVAVTNGSIIWIDHLKGERYSITGLTFRLSDISLGQPIPFVLSGRFKEHSVVLEGNFGPLEKESITKKIPLDVSVRVLEQLEIKIQGEIKNLDKNPQFELAVQSSPFSPRKLMAGLGLDFPLQTSDPETFNRIVLKAEFEGDSRNRLISSGEIDIDESRLIYSFNAADISRPDMTFDVDLDWIDLNRFLPVEDKKEPPEPRIKEGASGSQKEKADFSFLRRADFDGSIKVGRIRIKNLILEDTLIKISGKDNRIDFDLVKTACPTAGIKEKTSEGAIVQVPFKINMYGKIKDLDTNPQVALTVQATPFSPRKLMSGLGLDFPFKTSDPEAFTRIALRADFKGDFEKRLVSSGEVELDGSILRYSFNAVDISRPDMTFDIDLDRIDLDRLLPPGEKGRSDENGTEPETLNSNQVKAEPSFLHQSEIKGSVKAGQIKLKNLLMHDFLAKVSVTKGNITLNLERMECLGARAKGTFSADLTKQFPNIQFNYKVKQIQIERFLNGLKVKGGENIEGIFDLTSDAAVRFRDNKALLESIEGSVSLRSRKLLIHNLDVDKILKKYEKSQNFGLLDIGSFFVLGPFGPLLTKAYDHAATIQSLGKGKSRVTRLVSDWKISNGVASTEDVAFSTEMNRVAVKGKIDIQKQTFNNLKIAIIDNSGCMKYVQTVNGRFSKPEIKKTSFVVGSIVRPIASLLKKGKQFITRSKCKVFYNGKVIHPVAK